MRIFAAPTTMPGRTKRRRQANVEPGYLRQTACAAADGDGRGISETDRESGEHQPELRRALWPAGGSPLELARKPGHGAPPEEIQTRCRTLRGRYQLPVPAPDGRRDSTRPDQLTMGRATPGCAAHRPNRDWQIVAGA